MAEEAKAGNTRPTDPSGDNPSTETARKADATAAADDSALTLRESELASQILASPDVDDADDVEQAWAVAADYGEPPAGAGGRARGERGKVRASAASIAERLPWGAALAVGVLLAGTSYAFERGHGQNIEDSAWVLNAVGGNGDRFAWMAATALDSGLVVAVANGAAALAVAAWSCLLRLAHARACSNSAAVPSGWRGLLWLAAIAITFGLLATAVSSILLACIGAWAAVAQTTSVAAAAADDALKEALTTAADAVEGVVESPLGRLFSPSRSAQEDAAPPSTQPRDASERCPTACLDARQLPFGVGDSTGCICSPEAVEEIRVRSEGVRDALIPAIVASVVAVLGAAGTLVSSTASSLTARWEGRFALLGGNVTRRWYDA